MKRRLVELPLISGTMVLLSHSDPLCLLQLNSSLGFNILSAIYSLVGICLFTAELVIAPSFLWTDHHSPPFWNVASIPVFLRVLT